MGSRGLSYVFATRWAPYRPLTGGEYDYARNLAASLAGSVPVHGLALANPTVEAPRIDGLCWNFVPHRQPPRWHSLASGLPNVAFRNVSAAYLDALCELAADAEAVIVDFIAMAWVVAPLRARLRGMARPPAIVTINHNHEHTVRRQMTRAERSPVLKLALMLDTAKAGRLERKAAEFSNGLVVLTDADGAAFARESSTPWVSLPPAHEGPRRTARTITASTPRTACILGNHGAHHKRMVLSAALEALAGGPSGVTLDVAGAGDDEALTRRFPEVRFRGFVEHVEPYLDSVRLGLLPDGIGGGFKTRVLTYAANRVPMLALNSALAGMGFEPGVHYVGVDTLDQMTRVLPKLIDDFDRLNALQEAAFHHMATAFEWTDRGRDLMAFVERLRDGGVR